MSFALRPTDDLIRIAAAGGGMRLDASARLTNDLIRIASAARTGNAVLTLYGMSARMTDDLIRISAAGRGSVVLED